MNDPKFISNLNNPPSLMEDLMFSLNAKNSFSKDCKKCFGFGIIYNKDLYYKTKSGFEICNCLTKFCDKDINYNTVKNECVAPFEKFVNNQVGFVPCECKELRVKLGRLRYLEIRSQIPSKYSGLFLSDIFEEPYLTSKVNPIVEAYFMVNEYQKNSQVNQGLYLWGNTGCGKTLIACAILNEMIRFHQTPVLYAKFSRDIFSKIRATFSPNSPSYGDGAKIEKILGNTPILVIDDFETYKETDWVQSILFDLIDSRYENNLLTIITSNLPISYWRDTSNGRIYSRLNEMCKPIEIVAPDFRLINGSN